MVGLSWLWLLVRVGAGRVDLGFVHLPGAGPGHDLLPAGAGAFDAGATQVKIAEGHNATDILQLDECAALMPAHFPAIPAVTGWDEGFDALVMIGKHAMAGTPDGVLAHRGNRGVEFVGINGIRIGQRGTEAAEAGDYGFPRVRLPSNIGKVTLRAEYDILASRCAHPGSRETVPVGFPGIPVGQIHPQG